jgi:hypothetical protein
MLSAQTCCWTTRTKGVMCSFTGVSCLNTSYCPWSHHWKFPNLKVPVGTIYLFYSSVWYSAVTVKVSTAVCSVVWWVLVKSLPVFLMLWNCQLKWTYQEMSGCDVPAIYSFYWHDFFFVETSFFVILYTCSKRSQYYANALWLQS